MSFKEFGIWASTFWNDLLDNLLVYFLLHMHTSIVSLVEVLSRYIAESSLTKNI